MKFHAGDVVQLKSSVYDGGCSATVLASHPGLAEGEERDMGRGKLVGPAPPTYDLVMAARDGSALLTFTLPEHVLVGEEVRQ